MDFVDSVSCFLHFVCKVAEFLRQHHQFVGRFVKIQLHDVYQSPFFRFHGFIF